MADLRNRDRIERKEFTYSKSRMFPQGSSEYRPRCLERSGRSHELQSWFDERPPKSLVELCEHRPRSGPMIRPTPTLRACEIAGLEIPRGNSSSLAPFGLHPRRRPHPVALIRSYCDHENGHKSKYRSIARKWIFKANGMVG